MFHVSFSLIFSFPFSNWEIVRPVLTALVLFCAIRFEFDLIFYLLSVNTSFSFCTLGCMGGGWERGKIVHRCFLCSDIWKVFIKIGSIFALDFFHQTWCYAIIAFGMRESQLILTVFDKMNILSSSPFKVHRV